jgi:hypothetical protein
MGHDRAKDLCWDLYVDRAGGVILFLMVTVHDVELFSVAWSASLAKAPRVTVVSCLSR